MNNNFKHSRKSLRLQSYNYSAPGYYFITICTKNRECVFGEINNGISVLNKQGKIAEKFWLKMPHTYQGIRIPTFVVMPNHVHSVIHIVKNPNSTVGAIHELPLWLRNMSQEEFRKNRRQMYLSKIIGWYKMNVSRDINKSLDRSEESCWQRNYYEHIIRNQGSLNRITEYININPQLWERDRYFQ